MNLRRPRYLAYLLRLWQSGNPCSPVWRASLQDAHTGECHGFADFDALLRFLQRQTGSATDDREWTDEGGGPEQAHAHANDVQGSTDGIAPAGRE